MSTNEHREINRELVERFGAPAVIADCLDDVVSALADLNLATMESETTMRGININLHAISVTLQAILEHLEK